MDEVFRQSRLVRLHRVDIPQDPQRENPADHTGNFQQQLFLGRQRIDAADDHAVDRIGEVRLTQVAGIGRELAGPV